MIFRLWRKIMSTSPSSSGLGHRPFTAATRVRLPLGTKIKKVTPKGVAFFRFRSQPGPRCGTPGAAFAKGEVAQGRNNVDDPTE